MAVSGYDARWNLLVVEVAEFSFSLKSLVIAFNIQYCHL